MKNRGIVIVIIIIAALTLVFLCSTYGTNDSANKTNLTVSSFGPVLLSDVIEDIKTDESFRGYDSETIAWMESLGDKQVFKGNGTLVIMDWWDANKLNSEYATDVHIEEYFDCHVLENRSLGDIEYPQYVLLVEDVNYLGNHTYYYDV